MMSPEQNEPPTCTLHRFHEDEDSSGDGYGKQFRANSADSNIPMSRMMREHARPTIDVEGTNREATMAAMMSRIFAAATTFYTQGTVELLIPWRLLELRRRGPSCSRSEQGPQRDSLRRSSG